MRFTQRLKWIVFFIVMGSIGIAAEHMDRVLYRMNTKEILSFALYSFVVFIVGWWLSENRFSHLIDEEKKRQAYDIKKAKLKHDEDLRSVRQYARSTWIDVHNTFRKDLERNLTSFYFQFICIVISHVYKNYPHLLFEPVIGQTVIKTATEGVLDTGLHDRDMIMKRAEISAKRIAQFNDVNDLIAHPWIKQPTARIRQIKSALRNDVLKDRQ